MDVPNGSSAMDGEEGLDDDVGVAVEFEENEDDDEESDLDIVQDEEEDDEDVAEPNGSGAMQMGGIDDEDMEEGNEGMGLNVIFVRSLSSCLRLNLNQMLDKKKSFCLIFIFFLKR